MRHFIEATLAILVLFMIIVGIAPAAFGQALAMGYPDTVWSQTGSVAGQVGSSYTGHGHVSGAYVAIVNASNPGQEYAHTTSAEDGSYSFTGVRATFSSILGQGPDGTTGSYQRGQSMYMIMAKKGPDGEAHYSASFGVDANAATAITTSVVVPVDATVTPEPTPDSTVTVTPHPTQNSNLSMPTSVLPTPTPHASAPHIQAPSASVTTQPSQVPITAETPTPVPDSSGTSWVPLILAIIIVGIVAVAAVIYIVLRFW